MKDLAQKPENCSSHLRSKYLSFGAKQKRSLFAGKTSHLAYMADSVDAAALLLAFASPTHSTAGHAVGNPTRSARSTPLPSTAFLRATPFPRFLHRVISAPLLI